MRLYRRNVVKLLGLSYLVAANAARAADEAQNKHRPSTSSSPQSFHIGMVAYDGMTLLDFAAPADMFARPRGAKVLVLAKTLDPVVTDTGSRIMPDITLRDAPTLDILFVGGGFGVAAVMEDRQTIDFFRSRAAQAKWITSVCTGALVLGAAGLLRGYKATTHWSAMRLLPILGAEPVDQRVVIDRNRITGAGVTAGLDFALAVAAKIWGPGTAQLLQLGDEYDPAPPFQAGSPQTAPPAVVDRYLTITNGSQNARRAAAMRMAKLLN